MDGKCPSVIQKLKPKRVEYHLKEKDSHTKRYGRMDGKCPSVIQKYERVHLTKLRTIVANMEELKVEIFKNARQGKTAEKTNNHIKVVRRYYDEAARLPVDEDGCVEIRVEYRQKDNIGRYLCGGNLGLQTLTRRIRHTISRDYYHDVDIVNAHPNILLWLCRVNDIPCHFLEEYIDHRERVLKDIQKHGLFVWDMGTRTNIPITTRTGAKQFVLAKINGSPQKGAWKKAEEENYEWYLGFCVEIEAIWNGITRVHPEMLEYVEKQPKKGWGAPLHARATNRVLMNYENAILMVMNDYFEGCSIGCDVLIHDGCQIRKQDVKKQDLQGHLRDCERKIHEEMKMDTIQLSVKPMDEHLDLSRYVDVEFVDDRDEFMAINRISLKNRTESQKAFHRRYKDKIANENIAEFSALDDDWIVRESDVLKEVRTHMDIDIAAATTVCIRAGMGIGKTHSLINYIKGNKFQYITVLTSRIAFAENVLKRFESETGLAWEVYNDYKSRNRFDSKNIVIQAESLHLLVGDRRGGLLIIDECESFFTQMTSFETHKHHKMNVEKLEYLLKISTKIICMDAFLTEKTINVLKSFTINPSKYHYTLKNNPRIAQQIPLGHRCPCGKRNSCICPLVAHLIDQVKKGKKVYFVCSSVKRWREKIKPTLERQLPTKTILEYNSKHKSTSYKEIQTSWLTADVVCVTSSITVGVDFSLAHFDLVYMYISSASRNLVRDLFQAHYRVRDIADNQLFFSIDPNPRGLGAEYPLSRYRILQKLQATEGAIARLYARQSSSTPDWLMDLAVTNGLEASLSVMNLKQFFHHFLKECNYTLASPLACGGYEEVEAPPEEETFMALGALPDYTYADMKGLTSAKNRGENLSLVEQWGRQKYWFREKIEFRHEFLNDLFEFHRLGDDVSKLILEFSGDGMVMETTLWEFWCGGAINKFKNLKYELDNLGAADLGKWLSMGKYSQGNIGVLRHEFVREIKRHLKIDHTQDFGAVVKREDVENLVQWMNDSIINPVTKKRERVVDTLIYVFEVRNRSTDKSKMNIRSGVGLTNQIFTKWGISKIIKSEPKIRSRVNGKIVDTTPFIVRNRKTFDIWGFLARKANVMPPPDRGKKTVRRRHNKRNIL